MDIGASLGPYRIERELGAGGMGKVYAATGPDGVVALKVVHPHLLETPGFFKRFMREAQLGQSIRHENVVRTLDCDQQFADGKPQCFLVMEYVEGQTLADLLRELERVPEELCRHVAREICKGLAAVHEAGVVHRDLKPENVLITADHVVKVMDLGVAQVADEALRLSRTGAFVGSVEYAAPEQFKGGDVDGRTDLHALGLLLYELASGTHPYRGGSFHEVLGRVCDTDPRSLGEINPQLSAFFEEVVHTLLVKDPRGRFASATQLLDVLQDGEDSGWWHERARSLQADTQRPIRRIRIPRETAVYGRDEELDKLTALYEKAKCGDGQVVLIEGEAGIGKSRLVDELIARLHSSGEDVNFLFGSYPPGGAATAAGAFSAAYREHFGEGGSAKYLTQTPILVPGFDALLKGESAPPGVEQLTKISLQTCFVNVTRSLAAERVTVVLIDDLHFAPNEGRGLFTSLAMAAPGARVLLVGTTRPGVPDEWMAGLTRLDQTTQVPLHRLGAKDLIELLKDSFRSEQLALRLAGQIANKSDGNPFFAFEIIRGLREGQFITQRDDGSWVSTQVIDEIQIPSSVLDLVNARVAALDEDERELLDLACCWGFEFDATLVGDALGVARIPTLKRFARIEKRHRLVRCAGERFVFDHHQVQEALYSALPPQLAREYHSALAETLESRTNAADTNPETLDGALCVELCEQCLMGARGEKALRYLEASQTHLTQGYLHAQVVALTERALAIPDLLSGTERARTLLRLAGTFDVMVRRERQEECAREAERLADAANDDELRCQAAQALGTVLVRTMRHEESEAAFRRALSLAKATANPSAEVGNTVNLGIVFFSLGRLPEAQEFYERALALSRDLEHRPFEARALGNLGRVFQVLGRLPEALECYERALALACELGDRRGETIAIGNMGNVLSALGRVPEATEHHERSRALGREIGDREVEARSIGNLGNVFKYTGRLLEARENFERQIELSRELGVLLDEAIALVNLGPVWHELGDRARARTTLESSVALCREIGARYPEGYGLLDLGRLADEEGDLERALELTKESLAVRRSIGHGDGIAVTLIELGDLHARSGNEDAAREALDESVALSRNHGQKAAVALAQAVLACLPGEDSDAALAALGDLGEYGVSRRLSYLLWRATRNRVHLEEAKRQLDDLLANVPSEHHEAMLENVRLNREIMAGWRAEIDAGDEEDDEPRGTESETRVG